MSHPSTFALIPATPDVPLAAFARRLAAMLQPFGSTVIFGSADVDRSLNNAGIAQAQENTVVHEALTAWLGGQERDHGALVLQADPQWTAWTRRCVMAADRVLIVACADADPAPSDVERAVSSKGLKGRTELVLLHPDTTTRPTGDMWLAPRAIAAHHHVRLGNDDDVRRLARRVSGRSRRTGAWGRWCPGSPISVRCALAEAGITVDMVGGTSIGALIAAAVAAASPRRR
jgi:hypothetical protein